MTSKQLAEWKLFYQKEPFGPHIDSLRWAIDRADFLNANRDPKKQKAFKPEKFAFGDEFEEGLVLDDLDEERKQKRVREMKRNMAMWAEIFNQKAKAEEAKS